MRIVSRKHETIGLHLFDPNEFRLPKAGIVTVHDLESGTVRYFDASDERTRSSYKKEKTRLFEQTMAALRAAGIDSAPIGTHEDAADVLGRFFRAREHRR